MPPPTFLGTYDLSINESAPFSALFITTPEEDIPDSCKLPSLITLPTLSPIVNHLPELTCNYKIDQPIFAPPYFCSPSLTVHSTNGHDTGSATLTATAGTECDQTLTINFPSGGGGGGGGDPTPTFDCSTGDTSVAGDTPANFSELQLSALHIGGTVADAGTGPGSGGGLDFDNGCCGNINAFWNSCGQILQVSTTSTHQRATIDVTSGTEVAFDLNNDSTNTIISLTTHSVSRGLSITYGTGIAPHIDVTVPDDGPNITLDDGSNNTISLTTNTDPPVITLIQDGVSQINIDTDITLHGQPDILRNLYGGAIETAVFTDIDTGSDSLGPIQTGAILFFDATSQTWFTLDPPPSGDVDPVLRFGATGSNQPYWDTPVTCPT